MKKLLLMSVIFLPALLLAQKVENKNGVIQVDGQDLAKITIEKKNFGLTKNFEVSSLSGKKLIIAVPATGFETNKDDNSTMYYRLTFLTSSQVGIFSLSSLGQEKSFLKLIGTAGIIKGDSTDDAKIRELIATKGASPTVAVDYTIVSRSHSPWPVRIQEDKNFEQDGKIIGNFKPAGSANDIDSYEFRLPSSVIIAKVSFTGGNNAQNVDMFTAKDNFRRTEPFPQKDKILAVGAGIDKNWKTLERIGKWLVERGYM